jgi:hypothetical protein
MSCTCNGKLLEEEDCSGTTGISDHRAWHLYHHQTSLALPAALCGGGAHGEGKASNRSAAESVMSVSWVLSSSAWLPDGR